MHLVEGGLSRFHESKDLLNCEFAFDSDDEKVGLGWEIEDDARGWIEAILITSLYPVQLDRICGNLRQQERDYASWPT